MRSILGKSTKRWFFKQWLCPTEFAINAFKIHFFPSLYLNFGIFSIFIFFTKKKYFGITIIDWSCLLQYFSAVEENVKFALTILYFCNTKSWIQIYKCVVHSCMPSPLARDPIRVQSCVCCLFWTNRNCMAVTSIFLSISLYNHSYETFNRCFQ